HRPREPRLRYRRRVDRTRRTRTRGLSRGAIVGPSHLSRTRHRDVPAQMAANRARLSFDLASAGLSIPAEPALIRALEDWRRWLGVERNCSAHTLDAYSRDLAAFLAFLAEHQGHVPGLGDLDTLAAADFRSYLARRAADGLTRA